MAPLMAESMPAVVSPIFMLETSTATMFVSCRIGLSWIGRGCGEACARKRGATSSAVSIVECSVSVWYGWKSVVSPVMFFRLCRLISMNLRGSV